MDVCLDPNAEGHVRHVRSIAEQIVANKNVKLEDVKAFYHDYYGAQAATFAAVGDFDAPALKAQLAELFGSWKAKQSYSRIPLSMKPVTGQKIELNTPDKATTSY